MKKFIVSMGLGLAVIVAPNLSAADCDQCLAVIANASQASKPMTDRLVRCAENQSRECQVAVSKALFEKFKIIVDFFPRR
jgi:hypothetical protein